MYGTSRGTVNSFQAHDLSSHRSLGVAVYSLFDTNTNSLVMYPVCESCIQDEIHPVTHFMIEASTCDQLTDKFERTRWHDTLTQVIA